jgi:DNA-directed RNA polymerase specialized sigma24 family protein
MKDATKAILNHYLRQCPWMDRDDLAQEAELAKLEAARHWRPTGAPLEAYQATAMAHTLRRYTWDFRWPVYAPVRNLDTTRFDLRKAGLAAARRLPGTDEPADVRMDSARAAEMVRTILALLNCGDLAAEVLLREREPEEVAKARSVSVSKVYREVRYAKRKLQKKLGRNQELRAFVER